MSLDKLRHRKHTALRLRLPLSNTRLPAAQAASGREDVVEGTDYRGVPVLAALRSIPDTPWAMVAKVDTDEVYAPIRRLAWIVSMVIGALLAMAAVTIAFW